MAVKKDKDNFPPADKLELYRKLISTITGLELKGVSMPYTALNGNMFSFLDKFGSCGIRLPEKEREEFLKKYKTTLFHTQGTVLKEYVTVPDELLQNNKEVKEYFDISFEYAKNLKPKQSKK
ncbi:MAG: hypothetical protein H7Y00_01690 [Fimbriimonadaceae bacterium]|nr:hypothetical protein [Chitinophagales bacterium]